MTKFRRTKRIFIEFMKFTSLQLTLIVLLAQCLHATKSIGQDVLNQSLHVESRLQIVLDVIEQLEEHSDVKFTYSVQKIDVTQSIFIPKSNMTIQEILGELNQQASIKYDLFGEKYFVLSKRNEQYEFVLSGIHGTVMTQDGQPLQFANIVLLDENEELITGVVSDEFGRFEILDIEPGKYIMSISYLGLKNYKRTINYTAPIDLGDIQMENDATLLSEVQITKRRKLIKQKIDRLEVDVENSMLSSKGDALEVMRSTPGISVVNDRISMIGKSTMGVMINGKLLNLKGDDLTNYLRGIASEDIVRIEVITTPPARYTAEGNSGLINIVLKSARADSWNANVFSTLRQKHFIHGFAGGSFMYNKNKFSALASIFGMKGRYHQEQDDYAYFDDGLWYTQSPLTNHYKRLNGRVDLSYKLTPSWEVGAQYVRNHGNLNIIDAPYLPVFDYETNEVLRYMQSKESYIKQIPLFNSANLNNTIQLDTSGRKVILNVDYFTFSNPDQRYYRGESVIYGDQPLKQYYEGENVNKQNISNTAISLDFEIPTKWANLTFGGKLSRSISTNDIDIFNSGLVDKELNGYSKDKNDFDYHEDGEALYFSMLKNWSEKWTTKAGLRMEATQSKSISSNLNLDEKNSYIKLFPTAYVGYTPNKNASFNMSYSYRINRPTFLDLNPNIYFINPFQSIKGNAFIQPSFSNNLQFGYTWKSFNGSLYYSSEQNAFAQIPLADPIDKTIVFITQNYVDNYKIGFSQDYTFDKFSWWSSTNSFNVNFNKSVFNLEEEHDDFLGKNISLSTSNDFSIPNNDHWAFNVSFRHAFRGTQYIFTTLPVSNLSALIQYKMLDNQLKISLQATDILKTDADRLETTVNGVFQTARYYYDRRSVSLNISYRFGNKNISARRIQTGNEEEKGRSGN